MSDPNLVAAVEQLTEQVQSSGQWICFLLMVVCFSLPSMSSAVRAIEGLKGGDGNEDNSKVQ